MRVQEVPRRPAPHVTHKTVLQAVATQFQETGIRVAAVLRNEKVIGTISDLEITRASAHKNALDESTAEEWLSNPMLACSDDEEVGEALQFARKYRLSDLIVIGRQQQLLGVVSVADLVQPRPQVGAEAPPLETINEYHPEEVSQEG